jgi:hypothetical protein
LPGLIVALLVAGCTRERLAFHPLESSAEERYAGPIAVYYEVDIDRRNWGDVRVWSRGLFPAEDEEEGASIHVGLRLRNDTDSAGELSESYIEVNSSTQTFEKIEIPEKVTGERRVEPKEISRVDIRFDLPRAVDPDDVHSFEFNWAIQTPQGRYSQSTLFVRHRRPRLPDYWGPSLHFGTYGLWPYHNYWHSWYYWH